MFSLDIDTKGISEGALINIAWWLYEVEQTIKDDADFQDAITQAISSLGMYGTSTVWFGR